MTLTELAIKRPSFIVVIFAVLSLLGVMSYNQLSYELLPKLSVPVLTITTVYPGASPSEVETGVTKPVEDAISALARIKKVRSSSMESVSIIIIELESNANADDALSDAQRKLNLVTPLLPENAKTPTVSKISSDDFPILKYSLESNLEPTVFYQLIKDQIRPQITSIEGVAQVNLTGGEERAIRVNVNKEKLQANHLSLLQVTQAIGQSNLEYPTGKVSGTDSELRVRLAGKYDKLEDLRNLVLFTSPAGGKVTLADVAEVIDGRKELSSINRINGKSSIGMIVLKQSDANAITIAKSIAAKIAKIEKDYAKEAVKFSISSDTTEYTMAAADAVKHDLVLALFLVAAVILLFLHSLRDAFIVMLAIPCSFVGTFLAIYLFGYSLNLMTMLGLTLVVGILVDDSIVVLENIHRHLHMGKDRRTAALDGRNEIGFTALSITLVDVIVFLPLALSNAGVISAILGNFSWVIIISTLLSLFVSFTVTPLLASRMSNAPTLTNDTIFGRFNLMIEGVIESFTNGYAKMLGWSLRNKTITLIGIFAMLYGSLSLVASGFIGSAFIENGDRGEVILTIELEKTSTLENTSRVSNEVEQLLLKMPEVKTVLANIGGSSSREAGNAALYKSELTVKLVPEKERSVKTKDWLVKAKSDLAKSVSGTIITGGEIGADGSGVTPPIQIIISGPNVDSVMAYSQRLKSIVKATAGTTDVKLTIEGGVPEVRVDLDKDKATQMGLSLAVVGATMQNAYSGNDDSKFRENGVEYDIVVQLDGFDRRNSDDVANMTFMNARGENIRLSQIATITPSVGPSQLERTNRIASVRLDAQLRGREVGVVASDLKKAIADNPPPTGVSTAFIGDVERAADGQSTIGGAFGLSIILIYLLMVALYDSYVQPFVVLFAVPMALIGAFLTLAIVKGNLTIFTMMGMVVMVGLVTKNSILLVDFANQRRAEGESLYDALLDSVRVRMRPILMTTLAMVFGMMPVALAAGAGASWKNGLGWVLIGGLTSSMLLTPIIVPIMYYLVERLRLRINKWRGIKNAPVDEEVSAH